MSWLLRHTLLLGITTVTALVTFFPVATSFAQAPTPTCGAFGCFEVIDKLPKVGDIEINKDIGKFITSTSKKPLTTTANIIFQLGLAVLVMVSLIVVVIGGYKYMTAGGDGEKIKNAKLLITSALAGITIGMVGWILLNTVSSQFTKPEEPTIVLP